MRLLFCCEFYHPSRGGVQEVMRQIAERMASAGHDVTVATSYLPERKFTSHNGVAIQQFRVTGNAAIGMAGEVDRYRSFVREFDGDAILIKAAQQWTFDALWSVLDRIKARKIFIPCGFSGLYESVYQQYFCNLPQVLAKFDHLIFYAEKYRDIEFVRAHGLTKYSVLSNGASELEFEAPVEPGFRERLGIAADAFVFLTVGSPISTKGHSQVTEAFSRLDIGSRPATLILNGNWPDPPKIAGVIPRSGLTEAATPRLSSVLRKINRGVGRVGRAVDAVRREGWAGFEKRARPYLERRRAARGIEEWAKRAKAQVGKQILCTNLPRSDLVQAFMTADLFVFASNVEYSPLVLFEAAAAGTPFLSVPVGNAEEIARWTGGGMICPAARDKCGYTRVDPFVLAREMERCMKAPDMLARLGATGKERWRRKFTWQAIALQYESILSGRANGEKPHEKMGREIDDAAGRGINDHRPIRRAGGNL
jgi:glycosyltransferase involved in cell wall biosynthesis